MFCAVFSVQCIGLLCLVCSVQCVGLLCTVCSVQCVGLMCAVCSVHCIGLLCVGFIEKCAVRRQRGKKRQSSYWMGHLTALLGEEACLSSVQFAV